MFTPPIDRFNRRPVQLTLLGLIAGFVFCLQPCQAENSRLQIGFIGGFSGPGAVYGEPCRNGFEFGREAANGNNFEVIYEDDQFNPARTVSAFQKLAGINRVDLMIVLGSIPGRAVAPLAEKMRTPLIVWTGDPEVSRNRSWVIRSWVSATQEGETLAHEANTRGYDKIALVSSVDNYSSAVIDGIKRKLTGTVAASLEVAAHTMDFRSFLTKLAPKSISQMGICLAAGQSAALARQAASLGASIQFFGCETLNNQEEVRLAAGALEGAWFTTVPVEAWFQEKYIQRYRVPNTIGGAAVHYDLAGMLAEIAGRELRGVEILKALLQVRNRAGAAGTFSIVDQAGERHFQLPIAIKEIHGSK